MELLGTHPPTDLMMIASPMNNRPPILVEKREHAAMCPIRDVLSVLYKKWQMIILIAINQERVSFAEIANRIGDVSNRILSSNLQLLERNGYVMRYVDETARRGVSYELTDQGKSALELLIPLYEWASETKPSIDQNREKADANKKRRWF